MKKLLKLMALITALTFCIGTTVFAAETTYDSIEGGDFGDEGENDGSSTGDQEDITDDGTSGEADEESVAGGAVSPQTSASIAPIVAMAGLAAAGAAAGLKRK